MHPKHLPLIAVLVVHRSASCLACATLPAESQLMDQTHTINEDEKDIPLRTVNPV
jgi:hypothetical protein